MEDTFGKLSYKKKKWNKMFISYKLAQIFVNLSKTTEYRPFPLRNGISVVIRFHIKKMQ